MPYADYSSVARLKALASLISGEPLPCQCLNRHNGAGQCRGWCRLPVGEDSGEFGVVPQHVLPAGVESVEHAWAGLGEVEQDGFRVVQLFASRDQQRVIRGFGQVG